MRKALLCTKIQTPKEYEPREVAIDEVMGEDNRSATIPLCKEHGCPLGLQDLCAFTLKAIKLSKLKSSVPQSILPTLQVLNSHNGYRLHGWTT